MGSFNFSGGANPATPPATVLRNNYQPQPAQQPQIDPRQLEQMRLMQQQMQRQYQTAVPGGQGMGGLMQQLQNQYRNQNMNQNRLGGALNPAMQNMGNMQDPTRNAMRLMQQAGTAPSGLTPNYTGLFGAMGQQPQPGAWVPAQQEQQRLLEQQRALEAARAAQAAQAKPQWVSPAWGNFGSQADYDMTAAAGG